MRTGKVVALVVGVLFASMSVGLLFGGGALLWANAAERDDDGWRRGPGGRCRPMQ